MRCACLFRAMVGCNRSFQEYDLGISIYCLVEVDSCSQEGYKATRKQTKQELKGMSSSWRWRGMLPHQPHLTWDGQQGCTGDDDKREAWTPILHDLTGCQAPQEMGSRSCRQSAGIMISLVLQVICPAV